jgi:hypothetical protein
MLLPIFDERVRAFVVPRPGAIPTADALRSHAATQLAELPDRSDRAGPTGPGWTNALRGT